MMITITCLNNNLKLLNNKLHKFAFSQDKDGIVDLTIGKKYPVYGYKTNRYGKFLLVPTDTINTLTPWWMY